MFVWMYKKTDNSDSIKEKIHKWIEYQITPAYATVITWAHFHGVYFSTYEEQQQYRHAWVDHMIKVLES